MEIEPEDLPGLPLCELSLPFQALVLKAIKGAGIRSFRNEVLSVMQDTGEVYFGLYATGLYLTFQSPGEAQDVLDGLNRAAVVRM